MIERLQSMVAETMAALEERNALPAVCNNSQMRYAAHYIVKSSVFAPYFAALGITNKDQIGRSFDQVRGLEFFKVIMQFYYAKWYYKDDVEELNTVSQQLKCEEWSVVRNRAKYYYTKLLSQLSYQINASRNKGSEEQYRHDIIQREIRALFMPDSSGEEFMRCALLNGYRRDSIVLAAHLTGKSEDPIYKEWLRQNQDEVVETFVAHGASRELLSHLHGFTLTVLKHGNEQSFEKVRADKSTVGTVKHIDLNKLASARQYALEVLIQKIKHWMPVDEQPSVEESQVETPDTDNNEPTVSQESMSDEIFTVGSLTSASVPAEIMDLAKKLSKKHGPVSITNEASGFHIYLPDPDLLVQDGKKELVSKHVSVNAEKYLGVGKYDVDKYPTKENKQLYRKYYSVGKEVPCTSSMKTHKVYSVEALLAMLPLEKRCQHLGTVKRVVAVSSPDKNLVYDENGNLVPEWCGATVPLSSLPPDHPAYCYLVQQRHYDLKDLEEVWGIEYCTKALEEDRSRERFYSRLPLGCKNSPTGRIIIPIYDDYHVRRGWQARVIDFTNAHGDKFVWTDKLEWALVAKNGQDLCVSEHWPKGFAIHKYLNAKGSQRNALLFGLMQAVEFNKNRPFSERYCVLVEGPLDAMRGGPPCIALLGKSMSKEQADLIRKHFAVVCTVMDQDKAGQECLRRIYDQLPGMPIKELTVPVGNKDLGDCTYEEARELVRKYDPLNK